MLLLPDGTIRAVKPANGSRFELPELQGFVGGHIEAVPLGERWMIVNEEGKLRPQLPLNQRATVIAARGRFAGVRLYRRAGAPLRLRPTRLMGFYFRVLGIHTHLRVYMDGALCGNLVLRNEEFAELRAKFAGLSESAPVEFIEDPAPVAGDSPCITD